MSPEQHNKTLSALITETKKPMSFEKKQELQSKIQAFEEKFKMTTSEMYQGLADGSITETMDHIEWIFTVQLLNKTV